MNSDGLDNFDFSHEGYFEDYIFKGKKDQITECAQDCKKAVNCIGFSYMYGGDISNIKNCFIYQLGTNVENKIELDGESKAYIKCEGTYKAAVHIFKRIKDYKICSFLKRLNSLYWSLQI